MIEILFYVVMIILVFGSVMPLFSIIELIYLLYTNLLNYVDNKIGELIRIYTTEERIPDVSRNGLGTPTTVGHYVISCYINGEKIEQEAKRITKKYYWSAKELNDGLNKKHYVKYKITKKNKYILYIYEPKKSIFRIIMGFVIGLSSVLLMIILWKFRMNF